MENILLDEKKRTIKIVDFGLSNIYKVEEPLRTHCGSPEYAAPELFVNNKTYGPEVDLWSLGINFYALVVGKLPFTAAYSDEYRRQKLLKQIQKGLIAQHYKEMAQLSPECKGLLQGLIEPDSENRIIMRDIQTHMWITKCSRVPFHHYVAPPPDQALRAQVVEDLSAAMDLDITSVDSVVNEFRSDELSAMFNMMLDLRKAEITSDQEAQLRRDSALSSFDGSLPSTSNSIQCTPEPYRARYNCTPSPDFTHSSRSSSGHGSMRSSRHSRDYVYAVHSPAFMHGQRQHSAERRCLSCDLPDGQHSSKGGNVKNSRSMSPVRHMSPLLNTKPESAISPSSQKKSTKIRRSRLEQMRHKLFSVITDNKHHNEASKTPPSLSPRGLSQESTPEITPRAEHCLSKNTTNSNSPSDPERSIIGDNTENSVSGIQKLEGLVLQDVCETSSTGEQNSLTLAPQASPEDTSLGSETSIRTQTSACIPVKQKLSPDRWSIRDFGSGKLLNSPLGSPGPVFSYDCKNVADFQNLSDEEKIQYSRIHDYSRRSSSDSSYHPPSSPSSQPTTPVKVCQADGQSKKESLMKRSSKPGGSVATHAKMLCGLTGSCPLDGAACQSPLLLQPSPHNSTELPNNIPLHAKEGTHQSTLEVPRVKHRRETKSDLETKDTGILGNGASCDSRSSSVTSTVTGSTTSSVTKGKILYTRKPEDKQAQWKNKIARMLKRRLEIHGGSKRTPVATPTTSRSFSRSAFDRSMSGGTRTGDGPAPSTSSVSSETSNKALVNGRLLSTNNPATNPGTASSQISSKGIRASAASTMSMGGKDGERGATDDRGRGQYVKSSTKTSSHIATKPPSGMAANGGRQIVVSIPGNHRAHKSHLHQRAQFHASQLDNYMANVQQAQTYSAGNTV